MRVMAPSQTLASRMRGSSGRLAPISQDQRFARGRVINSIRDCFGRWSTSQRIRLADPRCHGRAPSFPGRVAPRGPVPPARRGSPRWRADQRGGPGDPGMHDGIERSAGRGSSSAGSGFQAKAKWMLGSPGLRVPGRGPLPDERPARCGRLPRPWTGHGWAMGSVSDKIARHARASLIARTALSGRVRIPTGWCSRVQMPRGIANPRPVRTVRRRRSTTASIAVREIDHRSRGSSDHPCGLHAARLASEGDDR